MRNGQKIDQNHYKKPKMANKPIYFVEIHAQRYGSYNHIEETTVRIYLDECSLFK